LTGDVTGTSTAWTGSANLSFATTLANAVIADANIKASGTANIAWNKLAAGTGARILVTGTGTTNYPTVLADSSAANQVLVKTATGTATSPSWSLINTANITDSAITTDKLANNAVTIAKLVATSGTADSSTFLRGDGAWVAPTVSTVTGAAWTTAFTPNTDTLVAPATPTSLTGANHFAKLYANVRWLADKVVPQTGGDSLTNLKFWTGTLQQYNAILSKDANTVYICK